MILQPDAGPIRGRHHLRSGPGTVRWGWLPGRDAAPVLEVDSGDVVTVDTVSHEGILEDFGRDPVGWFGAHGVPADRVLVDAVAVAREVPREAGAGPHVVTGPVRVRGAARGDLLRVDVLDLELRVPYGVISNRHGFGALAGELPDRPGTVSVFSAVEERAGRRFGTIPLGGGAPGDAPPGVGGLARFPLAPFLGIMGVAVDAPDPVHSTPPGRHGGNLDVAPLVAGSTLYLPVQVDGAGFYAGDPHFAQGNGEVCLTALEGSLRADLRLSVLRGPEARRAVGVIENPLGETDEHWIPIGLHENLDEALRDAVRQALRLLETRVGMERHLAYAYLSAAADFEVSQVVDGVKGVHCLIRKRDFPS